MKNIEPQQQKFINVFMAFLWSDQVQKIFVDMALEV